MKQKITVLSLVALIAAACSQPAGPTIVNVNVTNQVTVTVVLGNPVPSTDATCPAISKIRASYPESLDRGAKAALSATPLDAEGKKRDPKCDIADGVTWSAAPSELVSIADRKAFDTEVTAGTKAGNGTFTVDVGKAGSNSFPFKVN